MRFVDGRIVGVEVLLVGTRLGLKAAVIGGIG